MEKNNPKHYLEQELYTLIKKEDKIFNFLQKGSLDGLWYWDLENPEEEWMNPTFWETLGYDFTQMPHKVSAWQNIIYEDDLDLAKENLTKHFENPDYPYDQIVRYKHKNNSTVWIRCRGVAIRDESGKPVRMLGAHTNITKEKEAEKRIERANRRLTDIIKNSGDLVVILNEELNLLDVLNGSDNQDDLLLRCLSKIKNLKESGLDKLITLANEVLQTNKRSSNDILVEQSGLKTWYEVVISSIKNDLGKKELICVAHNISEKKLFLEDLTFTKELLEITSQVSKVGGWVVDLKENKIHWSDITKQIHEVPNDYEPSLEEGINFYKEGKSREMIAKVVENGIATGEGWDVELELVTAKNKDIWVRAKGKTEMDGDKCIRLYGTFEDITEKKKANKKLEEAVEMARDAAYAKSNFLSNMSHEIRTPLNAVIGMSHLLLDNNPREDQLEKLNTLHFSANNLLSLVNDILDYNKIEEGKIVFEKISFSLKETVKKLRHSFKFKAEEKGINLRVQLDPDTPTNVKGDPTRLIQILNNLLSNAIKFTKQGRITVSIELIEDRPDTTMLLFEVQDTGIGMSKEQTNIVFERFTQANAGTNRNFGGTGLGLSIVKKLLQLQNSDIEIHSEMNRGTTFSFNLLFDKVLDNEVIIDNKTYYSHQKAVDLKGMRILLVEDNSMNQLIATEFLKSWNVVLDYAINGVEAVERVNNNNYDVILMDIQMPEMDGYQATLRIKAMGGEKAKIPILAMTASTLVDVKHELSKVGMEDHILKPFNPQELNLKLSNYLYENSAKDQEKQNFYIEAANTINNFNELMSFDKINQLSTPGSDFKEKILNRFLLDLDKFYNDYKSAVETQDSDKLKSIAHRNKSMIAILSIDLLSEQLKEHEIKISQHNWQEIDLNIFFDTVCKVKGKLKEELELEIA